MSKYRIYNEGNNSIMALHESAIVVNNLSYTDIKKLLDDTLHGVRLVEGGDEDE